MGGKPFDKVCVLRLRLNLTTPESDVRVMKIYKSVHGLKGEVQFKLSDGGVENVD